MFSRSKKRLSILISAALFFTLSLVNMGTDFELCPKAHAQGIHIGIGFGGGWGGYCPVPQYPCFPFGAPGFYSYPPAYLPGGCMPGFYPGCVPYTPYSCPYPMFFGSSFVTESINCIELPASDFREGTTGSGRSSKGRVEELLPTLTNEREISDTTGSTNTDISSVTGDVFKTGAADQPSGSKCLQAARLCKAGKFEQSIQTIDQEASQHESDATCSYVRANANLGLGKLDDALKDVRQAIAKRPDYAPNYFTEGAILAEMKQLPEAVKSYTKALSIRNNSPKFLRARAGVYYRLGRYIDAIRDYEQVLALDSNDPGALYMRGMCYFMVGQYLMTAVSFDDYLAKNPNDAAALYNRGSAYFELGKYNQALADFDKALAIEPNYVPCLYKRCLTDWRLGQWQAALDDSNKALSITDWKDENSAYLALCNYFLLLKQKKLDAAATVLDTSLSKLGARTWPYPLLLYLKGSISESDLLARAEGGAQKTQAQAYIALKAAWSGKDGVGQGKDAVSLLETVRRQGDSSVPEYGLAVEELYRNKIKDITNVSRPVKNKFALVIGVSKFRDPSINLRYADKDATDFYNFLLNQARFAKENVKLLTNEQATRANILGALGASWLPRVANQDDLVLVYFSTHGSPSAMDAKGINYLVAYDTDKEVLYALNNSCSRQE